MRLAASRTFCTAGSNRPTSTPRRLGIVRTYGLNFLIVALFCLLGVWGFWFDWKIPAFLRSQPRREHAEAVVQVSPEQQSPSACIRVYQRRRLEFPSADA